MGDQKWPVSSSRIKIASPPTSLTGSLFQGVRRISWAFSLQVYEFPFSEITVPKLGFANTFTHGAGVSCVSDVLMTYSDPSGAKPPIPLKKIRSLGCNSSSTFLKGR